MVFMILPSANNMYLYYAWVSSPIQNSLGITSKGCIRQLCFPLQCSWKPGILDCGHYLQYLLYGLETSFNCKEQERKIQWFFQNLDFNKNSPGNPWKSSGEDSMLPAKGPGSTQCRQRFQEMCGVPHPRQKNLFSKLEQFSTEWK